MIFQNRLNYFIEKISKKLKNLVKLYIFTQNYDIYKKTKIES
jgi:hypothetical protein